jgi:hypothetical protein
LVDIIALDTTPLTHHININIIILPLLLSLYIEKTKKRQKTRNPTLFLKLSGSNELTFG